MYDKEQLLETHKRFINKGWYDSAISIDALERWLNNFPEPKNDDEFDVRICAKFLLDSIIFYQNRHIIAIIKSLMNQQKSALNEKKEKEYGRRLSEDELKREWEQYIKDSCIIAAAKPEDTGGSAHSIARHWRNKSNIDGEGVINLRKAVRENNKKHIIFVDDFLGTGTKMKRFLSDKIFEVKSLYGFTSVQEFMSENADGVDYSVAVIAMCEEGYDKLSKLFPNIKFLFGDYYSKEYNLTNENFSLYSLYSKDKKEILAYIQEKQNELDPDNKYALNLPVVFSHGCPNNTLALFYKNTSVWTGLFDVTNPNHR